MKKIFTEHEKPFAGNGEIPKIIHQIWSGIDEPLPEIFRQFGETWKEHHPTWKYEFWDNKRMITSVKRYYPQYWKTYEVVSFLISIMLIYLYL